MIDFLFQKYKSYIICAGFLVILCAVTFGYYKIKQIGYKQCKAEYAAAEKQAQDDARKQIIKIEDKYKKIRRELANVQSENSCVGDRVRAVVDRL